MPHCTQVSMNTFWEGNKERKERTAENKKKGGGGEGGREREMHTHIHVRLTAFHNFHFYHILQLNMKLFLEENL